MTLQIVVFAEPSYEDKLTFDSDQGVKYQADFTIFGRGGANAEPRPGRILPPVQYSPPTSFTDPDTFFKSVGKPDESEQGSRRRR